MTRTSRLAAAFVLAASVLSVDIVAAPLAPAPAAPVAGRLRWVRGMVTSASADSLTLKLRNKKLTIALDAGSVTPAVGSVVEAHYAEQRGGRRAVLMFGADRAAELSKRPAASYRGVVKRVKRGTVSLTANTKSHGINMDKKTRLVDADGRAVANGSKEITGVLPAGEDVLVKYEGDGAMVMVGDVMVDSSADKAIEIRKLR